MDKEAVIFDMDGVLIDTERHHKIIEQRIFRELEITITDEEHLPFVGMASDELWQAVIAKYGLDKSPEDLLELNNRRIIEYFTNRVDLKQIPGIKQVLNWLQENHIPIAVASSSSEIVIDALLGITGLIPYFPTRVGGQVVEKSKPEPFIYLYTANILGVTPGKCIAIEDSTNGIAAAISAGMYCIAYRGTGYHGQDQSRADKVIDHFDELIPFMANHISKGRGNAGGVQSE